MYFIRTGWSACSGPVPDVVDAGSHQPAASAGNLPSSAASTDDDVASWVVVLLLLLLVLLLLSEPEPEPEPEPDAPALVVNNEERVVGAAAGEARVEGASGRPSPPTTHSLCSVRFRRPPSMAVIIRRQDDKRDDVAHVFWKLPTRTSAAVIRTNFQQLLENMMTVVDVWYGTTSESPLPTSIVYL
jgi:hypothetical protein